MSRPLEQSLKDHVRALAKKEDRKFNDVWLTLVLERFLIRLARSKYRSRFIWKGGLLLARYLEIGRETTDLDFLAQKIKIEEKIMSQVFGQICSVSIQDGFQFDFKKITKLKHPHMAYEGYRIFLAARLEKTVTPFAIDIGAGDRVTSERKTIQLHKLGSKFEGRISLCVYPPESIFSEKLHSVVSRGGANSRMKDYHDLYLMMKLLKNLRQAKLKKAIRETFSVRGPNIEVPIGFSDSDLDRLQGYWVVHLRVLGKRAAQLRLPEDIRDIVTALNRWLGKHHLP